MFEVTARPKVREGELDEFKQQAAELMRLAREKDRKTLRYDWFISDGGTRCESGRATSTPTACSSTPTTSGRREALPWPPTATT